MSTLAIRLKFRDGLHIGRGFEELDKTATHYGSDALKSAIFAVGLAYFPHWADKSASRFFNGFRISSVFPWSGEELFLPKPPIIRFKFENPAEDSDIKMSKKLEYISYEILSKWTQHPHDPVIVRSGNTIDQSFVSTGNGLQKFIFTSVQQRVTVSIGDNEGQTQPYYFERMFFAENSGLYFIFDCPDKNLRSEIITGLKLLGDAGIGTDRTVSNGQFDIANITPILLPSGSQGLKMALGLYLPTKEEIRAIDLEMSYWGLIKRGGYIAGASNQEHLSIRKNSIYFFTEGSLFKTNTTLSGRYIDLRPDWNDENLHPIWRCGQPIFLNL